MSPTYERNPFPYHQLSLFCAEDYEMNPYLYEENFVSLI